MDKYDSENNHDGIQIFPYCSGIDGDKKSPISPEGAKSCPENQEYEKVSGTNEVLLDVLDDFTSPDESGPIMDTETEPVSESVSIPVEVSELELLWN